jgi:hypothetical protein
VTNAVRFLVAWSLCGIAAALLWSQSPGGFVDLGAVKEAFAGSKICYFYGAPAAPYGVQVVCYASGGILELNAATVAGTAMGGWNSDNSITWEIGADRSYKIAVGGVEYDGTF